MFKGYFENERKYQILKIVFDAVSLV